MRTLVSMPKFRWIVLLAIDGIQKADPELSDVFAEVKKTVPTCNNNSSESAVRYLVQDHVIERYKPLGSKVSAYKITELGAGLLRRYQSHIDSGGCPEDFYSQKSVRLELPPVIPRKPSLISTAFKPTKPRRRKANPVHQEILERLSA